MKTINSLSSALIFYLKIGLIVLLILETTIFLIKKRKNVSPSLHRHQRPGLAPLLQGRQPLGSAVPPPCRPRFPPGTALAFSILSCLVARLSVFPHEAIHTLPPLCGLHFDRVAGGDRHYRHPRRDAAARLGFSQGQGPARQLCFQPAPVGLRPVHDCERQR